MQKTLLEVPAKPRRKSPRREPRPRFKPDLTHQLDPLGGCPDLQVPKDHLARHVRDAIEKLDCSSIEAGYSSLGRHGFQPRHLLGVLVYGSLVGTHHSTKLGRALQTDAAFRFVSGGHAISAGKLREFRRTHLDFFLQALEQTLRMAQEAGLLDAKALAVDSVRLRAHASTKAARTLKRSKERLQELSQVDPSTLDEAARAKLEEKKAKHRAAIAECERLGRTNLVTTSPSAGLLKFPSGASAPGHRATVTACGVKERLVVDVLVDADGHDFGKLPGAVERAKAVLSRVGVDVSTVQVAADAGYWSKEDLRYAEQQRQTVDVLIAERKESRRRNEADEEYFSIEQFVLGQDQSATCPAGRKMEGPYRDKEQVRYHGVGCETCPLKPRCARGKRRYLTLDPEWHKLQSAMAKRMKEAGAEARYQKRMATIEPVFSSLQDGMGFRRVSSRNERSVLAELALKFLAYNLGRLIQARRLFVLRLVIAFPSTL